MRRRTLSAVCGLLLIVLAHPAGAQARRTTKKPTPPKPAAAARVTARPEVLCSAILGTGAKTGREFCDVQVGRDPHEGIIISLPRHKGPLVLTFDLHNRETYSEQLVREKRAFMRHTATIGVLTLEGGLITRAVVDTEFRNANDLFDRVSGGAGPAGLKAVAPIGDEPIRIEIPEDVDAVSVLGEKLLAVGWDGTETVAAPGRPIAIISNVVVDYKAAPPPPRKKPATKKR